MKKSKNEKTHKKTKKNEKMEKLKNEKNENKKEKCTARDDTSSTSAAALRDGRTPHTHPQLRGLL